MPKRRYPQREFVFQVRVLENALPVLDQLRKTSFIVNGDRAQALTDIIRHALIEAGHDQRKPSK